MITKEQKIAILNVIEALKDAVAEAGEHGAPEGVLYAAFMAHGMSLENFNLMIGCLIKTGNIKKKGNLLFKA